jgi:hypothetical protein
MRRIQRLVAYPNHLRSNFGDWLVLGQGNVGQQRPVTGNGGVGVALNVCTPLPAGRIRMTSAHVLGLEPLKLLLVAKFVGLFE